MIKYLLAAAIALAGLTTLANAADPSASGPRRGGGTNQLERLTTALKLTDDQKPKVEAVLKKQGEKMRELRQDQSVSREDRRAKMQKIQEETTAEMNTILTAEQQEQYKKLLEQRRQGGNRGNRPAPQQ